MIPHPTKCELCDRPVEAGDSMLALWCSLQPGEYKSRLWSNLKPGEARWVHEVCYQERIVKPLTAEGALVELARLVAQLRMRERIGGELLACLLLPQNLPHLHPKLRELAERERARWGEA